MGIMRCRAYFTDYKYVMVASTLLSDILRPSSRTVGLRTAQENSLLLIASS